MEERSNEGFLRGLLIGIFTTAGLFAIIIVVLALTFFGRKTVGAVVEETAGKDDELLDEDTVEKIDVLSALLDKYYYDDISTEDKQTALFKGVMESAGDPYTVYYTAEEYEEFQVSTLGNYAGIGAILTQDANTKQVSIIRVYENSPAEKCGLKAEDIIIAADEYVGTDMTLDNFVQHIRGPEGTTVAIRYERNGEEKTVDVVRESITVPSVSYSMLEDDIGYIIINEFSKGTADEFINALQDLKKQGMKGVIYDLRTNGGGLVDSATDMLDYILPEGITVYMLNKAGDRTDYTSDGNAFTIPTVVLVSEETASAAEIFTGAIKDFKAGTVIGTQTFGKGIVQTTLPLTDGSAVKITTETYYTPNGTCIHGVGIEPDIELEFEYLGEDEDDYEFMLDNQIAAGVEELKKQIGE